MSPIRTGQSQSWTVCELLEAVPLPLILSSIHTIPGRKWGNRKCSSDLYPLRHSLNHGSTPGAGAMTSSQTEIYCLLPPKLTFENEFISLPVNNCSQWNHSNTQFPSVQVVLLHVCYKPCASRLFGKSKPNYQVQQMYLPGHVSLPSFLLSYIVTFFVSLPTYLQS